MTAHAVHGCRGNIQMRLHKTRSFSLMTLHAEVLQGIGEEMLLSRKMRLVTGGTVLLNRRVYFSRSHPLFQLFMTVQTEVKVLGKQQFFEVCLVGVVAL